MSEITENEDIINSLPKTSQYFDKLETIEAQLPPILTDFKKYYVFYNKNPDSAEYHQMYSNIKNNLTNANSELFVLSNDVQSNTEDINKLLFELNVLIKEEKKVNRELKKKLNIAENENNASNELISDYTEMYNYDYLKNFGLFLSILIAMGTISKLNAYSISLQIK